MHNFVFHNPTKILFGKGTIQSVGTETSTLGTSALLVFGQNSLIKSGTHAFIHKQLEEERVTVTDFGGISPNPLLSQVRAGIELVKKNKIDVIVGAGGGSVIDTAKAIAAGAVIEHDVWKFFNGKKSVKASLPVLSILTIPGSGSAMNSGMVITNDATRQKIGFGHRLLHPVTSILDPEETYTVSKSYTAYGAIDAITHILEFYLSTQEEEIQVQQRFMEGLIASIMESCNRAIADPHDYGARAGLMWGSTLALNGLTAAGLGKVGFPMHLIEHALSGLYNTPHGAGLAAIIPGWLRMYAQEEPLRLSQLGQTLFPGSLKVPGDVLLRAQYCVDDLCQWITSIGAPASIDQLSIPSSAIDTIAEHTRELARVWRLREYTPERIKEILRYCFNS